VDSSTLKFTRKYAAVPSKSIQAFLQCDVVNTGSCPLLAGPANVYVDAAFACKTQLKFTNTNDKLSLPLGVDPAVKVQYRVCINIFSNKSKSCLVL